MSAIGAFALALLILLSIASSNTEFFDKYFLWLYAANVVVGICLTIVILTLVIVIAVRWYKGRFGTRLIAKLAMIFALVGVVPGLILYGVSLQFVSRSIETWFDVKVESALEAGLELGRAIFSASLQELQDEGGIVVNQIQGMPNQSSPGELTLVLSRLRDGKQGPSNEISKDNKTPKGVIMKPQVKPVEPVERDVRFDHVRPLYLEALTLVERLHRRLLDVIKDEFDRRGRADINSVQALLLYNIGDKELTAGELRTRGYYLGSNVSYNLKKLVEMATVVAGGEDAFRRRPLIGFGCCPVSPLQLPRDATDVIIESARAWCPDTILSMAMSGGSSPVTLAGTLVLHNAEVLGGIVLAQLTERGCPITYGSSTTAMDLKLATASVGSPELALFSAACAQIARHYGLPTFVAGL